MPKKNQPPQVYKTESQLKEEALKKHAVEAKASTAISKSELQRKLENFWYHYKWHTIGAALAVFLLSFFIKDMFFRTKPDLTIIVVSERVFSEQQTHSLTGYVESHAVDFNGDNKVTVSADFISPPQDVDESRQTAAPVPDLTGGQQDMANAMKLMAVMSVGSDPIYLLDEAAYAYITKLGQGEAVHNTESSSVFEEYGVPVNAEKLGFDGADAFDGMRFCLRISSNDPAYYEYCKQLLEAIDRA